MIIAKQVTPEAQESPLFLGDEFFPDNIAVYGNRHYNEHLPEVFARVCECLNNGELYEAVQDFETGGYFTEFYDTLPDAVIDLLPPEKSTGYSVEDIQELKRLVSDYGRTRYTDDIQAAVLSIVTGKKWVMGKISGCCQGDWQNICYPVDEWTKQAIACFEMEYFNTGTEYIVTDEDGEQFSMYCYEWTEDGQKQEIADASGASVDNVKLLVFTGYLQIAQYREVE